RLLRLGWLFLEVDGEELPIVVGGHLTRRTVIAGRRQRASQPQGEQRCDDDRRYEAFHAYLLVTVRDQAASAACASWVMKAKNAGDWPTNSPVTVKNFSAPIAAPSVSVGRMIAQTGNLRSRKIVGSGMIRLGCKPSPADVRSGNVSPLVGSVSGASG